MEEKKENFILSYCKKNYNVKGIVVNALIAALYAVVTMLCGPLSYVGGSLQLRFSEMLNLLVFFNPSYSLGLTLGCLLANVASMYGAPDIILGTLGTFVSCLLIVLISKTLKNMFICTFMPCLINAIVVPFIVYLYDTTMIMDATLYFTMFGWIFLGEFICITCVGYPIFLLVSKKYQGFHKLIGSTQNFEYKF